MKYKKISVDLSKHDVKILSTKGSHGTGNVHVFIDKKEIKRGKSLMFEVPFINVFDDIDARKMRMIVADNGTENEVINLEGNKEDAD